MRLYVIGKFGVNFLCETQASPLKFIAIFWQIITAHQRQSREASLAPQATGLYQISNSRDGLLRGVQIMRNPNI